MFDPHSSTISETFDDIAMTIHRWMAGDTPTLTRPASFCTLMTEGYVPEPDEQQLRHRACALGLAAQAHAMAHKKNLTSVFMVALADSIAQYANWRSFAEDPALRYAFLVCVINAVHDGLSDEQYTSWNNILAEWFPQTKGITLDRRSTGQTVAHKVFDPVWLQLSDIDVDALDWEEVNDLLQAHPPIIGDVTSEPSVAVTLPPQLTPD